LVLTAPFRSAAREANNELRIFFIPGLFWDLAVPRPRD
jgi:hypothetical protein